MNDNFDEQKKKLGQLIEEAKKKYGNCTTGILKRLIGVKPCEEPLRTAILTYRRANDDYGPFNTYNKYEQKRFNEEVYYPLLAEVNQSIDALTNPVSSGGKRRRRPTKRGRRKSLRRRKTVRK